MNNPLCVNDSYSYKGRNYTKFLMGASKRKVIVLVPHRIEHAITDDELQYAAIIANIKGWKTIILKADDTYGEDIEAVNPHQFQNDYKSGRSGIWIGSL